MNAENLYEGKSEKHAYQSSLFDYQERAMDDFIDIFIFIHITVAYNNHTKVQIYKKNIIGTSRTVMNGNNW